PATPRDCRVAPPALWGEPVRSHWRRPSGSAADRWPSGLRANRGRNLLQLAEGSRTADARDRRRTAAAGAGRTSAPPPDPPAAGYEIGKIFSRSSAGRGMTWTPTSSPTRRAAAAPASVAAFTEPTSPRTIAVTRPASTFRHPTNTTFAVFTMASAASIMPTSPRVSIIPSASPTSRFDFSGIDGRYCITLDLIPRYCAFELQQTLGLPGSAFPVRCLGLF